MGIQKFDHLAPKWDNFVGLCGFQVFLRDQSNARFQQNHIFAYLLSLLFPAFLSYNCLLRAFSVNYLHKNPISNSASRESNIRPGVILEN